MNAADNLILMTDLITQSSHCVDLLEQCLTSELESLNTYNADELLKSSQKKEDLMLELHAIESTRKKLLKDNNIESKDEYLQWLDQLDASSQLKKQWLELATKVLECQKQNSKNGIISENMASASEQALNILSGNNTPADNTYAANGKKPGNINSLHNTTA